MEHVLVTLKILTSTNLDFASSPLLDLPLFFSIVDLHVDLHSCNTRAPLFSLKLSHDSTSQLRLPEGSPFLNSAATASIGYPGPLPQPLEGTGHWRYALWFYGFYVLNEMSKPALYFYFLLEDLFFAPSLHGSLCYVWA